jgi:protein-S-isoprenylcysteine O-methyltransferase Ste14
MFVLVRAVIFATVFIALVLVYLPARLLARAGIGPPAEIALPQVAGMIIAGAGAVIALWCVLTFAVIGKGTPAPFDPPRLLVTRGPYHWVRNPMYIGAAIAMAGAALFYQSFTLLAYSAGFLVTAHLFVLLYEEPALRRSFGPDYQAYCDRVGRWWPRTSGSR